MYMRAGAMPMTSEEYSETLRSAASPWKEARKPEAPAKAIDCTASKLGLLSKRIQALLMDVLKCLFVHLWDCES